MVTNENSNQLTFYSSQNTFVLPYSGDLDRFEPFFVDDKIIFKYDMTDNMIGYFYVNEQGDLVEKDPKPVLSLEFFTPTDIIKTEGDWILLWTF